MRKLLLLIVFAGGAYLALDAAGPGSGLSGLLQGPIGGGDAALAEAFEQRARGTSVAA